MTITLIDAYQTFLSTSKPFIHIDSEDSYQSTLLELEKILDSTGTTSDYSLTPLVDMLATAIDEYESKDQELMQFISDALKEPKAIVLLKTLIDNYDISHEDLPEIGSASLVSNILDGKKALSTEAIKQLSKRFDLKPSMFLE